MMHRLICCLGRTALTLALITLAGTLYAADPPTRVARLNYMAGAVTFSPAGRDDWAYPPLNRPLTTGDRLWVDRDSRAELHVGSTAVRLGPETSLDILTLDDDTLQLKLVQGTVSVRPLTRRHAREIEIDTPNLALSPLAGGEYRLDVDPDHDTTTVTARRGRAEATGDHGSRFPIREGEQARFTGTDLRRVEVADAPRRDGFDRWVADRSRREDNAVSARYLGREVIGYESLDDYGDWRDDPVYGDVWIPRVTIVHWAPYRYGHWAWIAPWGWTWIDDTPWGFAPFHYGRWVYLRETWAWVPGPVVARPVYAPALVVFVGSSSGKLRWSLTLSSGAPAVAWFPLAPGERYRPAYASSPTYVTQINQTVTHITQNVTVNQTVYVNQRMPGAVTAVPAAVFVKGQPIAREIATIPAAQLKPRTVASAPPIAPVQQSLLGAAKPVPPPERASRIDARPALALRPPAAPAALHDTLAERAAQQHRTVPGAGPAWAPPPARTSATGTTAPRSRVTVIGRPGEVVPPPSGQPPANRAPAGETATSPPAPAEPKPSRPETPQPTSKGAEPRALPSPAAPSPERKTEPRPETPTQSRPDTKPNAPTEAPLAPPRKAEPERRPILPPTVNHPAPQDKAPAPRAEPPRAVAPPAPPPEPPRSDKPRDETVRPESPRPRATPEAPPRPPQAVPAPERRNEPLPGAVPPAKPETKPKAPPEAPPKAEPERRPSPPPAGTPAPQDKAPVPHPPGKTKPRPCPPDVQCPRVLPEREGNK